MPHPPPTGVASASLSRKLSLCLLLHALSGRCTMGMVHLLNLWSRLCMFPRIPGTGMTGTSHTSGAANSSKTPLYSPTLHLCVCPISDRLGMARPQFRHKVAQHLRAATAMCSQGHTCLSTLTLLNIMQGFVDVLSHAEENPSHSWLGNWSSCDWISTRANVLTGPGLNGFSFPL